MGAADIHLDNLWLPFTPNKDFHQSPRVFTGADGMYFTTADGRKVLDGVSSLWCVGAGQPARNQRRDLQAVANAGLLHRVSVRQ